MKKPGPHPALPLPRPSGAKKPDPVLQDSHPARAKAAPVTTQFDGIGANNYAVRGTPPDPNASVGSTQIVETVNAAFAVYSKTGATILPPTNNNAMWSGFGGPCETTNDGDPIVRWDTLANRWVFTQFANVRSETGPYYQCVAVSTSPDATGTYNRYAFTYENFNDYGKLSVWPDGYYVTYNMFAGGPQPRAGQGSKICALDRARMLTGAAATQQCFDITNVTGFLPADLDGSTPPPAGAPNVLVGQGLTNTTLTYLKYHVDWANPAQSTVTGGGINVAPYTIACQGQPRNTCIPQGGTTQQLEAMSDRMMYRLAYRNYGIHESLVLNHSINAGTSVGVRWYELRLAGGDPVVHQQGTYAPDNTFRWMGSVAQDRAGNIALGYSQSSSTTHPSIRFTGRSANDPLGEMTEGETTVITGGGSQIGSARWGDYTSMAVDPADDCKMWYTNQYIPANGVANWHTRIASFTLPTCLSSS